MQSGKETTENRKPIKQRLISFLALFTSAGTLICCALPAAIAAIAGGAALGAFISTFPWLVPISRYKEWIFVGAGIFIILSGILTLRPQGKVACSITGGKGCEIAGRLTKATFWGSVIIYFIGAFFCLWDRADS